MTAEDGIRVAKAYVDVVPKTAHLAKVARIIEKHMGALATDLEALDGGHAANENSPATGAEAQ